MLLFNLQRPEPRGFRPNGALGLAQRVQPQPDGRYLPRAALVEVGVIGQRPAEPRGIFLLQDEPERVLAPVAMGGAKLGGQGLFLPRQRLLARVLFDLQAPQAGLSRGDLLLDGGQARARPGRGGFIVAQLPGQGVRLVPGRLDPGLGRLNPAPERLEFGGRLGLFGRLGGAQARPRPSATAPARASRRRMAYFPTTPGSARLDTESSERPVISAGCGRPMM